MNLKRKALLVLGVVALSVGITYLSGMFVDQNFNLTLGKREQADMYCRLNERSIDKTLNQNFIFPVKEEQVHFRGSPFAYNLSADVEGSCNLAGAGIKKVSFVADVVLWSAFISGIIYVVKRKKHEAKG